MLDLVVHRLDDQNPTKAPYGSTITLVPSLGHEPVPVPEHPDQTYTFAQAQAALQAVGLTATRATQLEHDGAGGPGHLDVSPASGAQAPYGSAVTVNVSTGPPTTPVPNVIGDTVPQATTAFRTPGSDRLGRVRATRTATVEGTQPSIGSTVPTGSSVQLFTH